MNTTELEAIFDELWPLNRSLSGEGNRQSFAILNRYMPFTMREIPSGTACFDWTIPPEWNVTEAWIKNDKGEKVIDFKDNNLHLLGYSIPIHETMSFESLRNHLYTLPDFPDAIPYRTSYYARRWGFCMSQNQFDKLDKDAQYEVFIDSRLDEKGCMTVGEATLKGDSEQCVYLTSYICHPSMANNELSGPLLLLELYQRLKRKHLRYTYKFLLMPETIGSIWYLSEHYREMQQNTLAGIVLTCVGDRGNFSLKKSRIGDSDIDRIASYYIQQKKGTLIDFFPSGGSDERQYCSPGINLPFCSITRTMYEQYKEYHTSKDDKSFISFDAILGSADLLERIIDTLENNEMFVNLMPYCEVQLGKRGLYPTLSAVGNKSDELKAMMWLLNYSDGKHTLFDIIQKSNIDLESFLAARNRLLEHHIIERKS